MAINCAAVVGNLLESELFGHEKGAFTGAEHRKTGILEHAGRGTVLLDEIGEFPLDLQAKLLRVLQEREFQRIGDVRTIPLQARVIAATNRDLEGHGEGMLLPRGPLLPAQGLCDSNTGPSGTHRGYRPARGVLPQSPQPGDAQAEWCVFPSHTSRH